MLTGKEFKEILLQFPVALADANSEQKYIDLAIALNNYHALARDHRFDVILFFYGFFFSKLTNFFFFLFP